MTQALSGYPKVAYDAELPIQVQRSEEFAVDRTALWAAFGDTPRFTRELGEPRWQMEPPDPRESIFVMRGRFKTESGQDLSVEIEPHQWVRGRYFAGPKRFTGLPIGGGILAFEFSTPQPGRTQVEVTMRVHAASPDLIGAAAGFCSHFVEQTLSVLRRLSEAIASGVPDPYMPNPPPDAEEVRARGMRIVGEMARPGAERAVLTRLVEHIAVSDSSQLARLRPTALAAVWGMSPELVLRAFLRASRAGLLEMAWDVLCPMCRGPASRMGRLDGVAAHSECGACVSHYDVEFDRLVEATFRPATWLRVCDDSRYCQAGPSNAEHVEAQLVLQPGVPQTLELDLQPGTYQIWMQRGCAGVPLRVDAQGPAQADVVLLDAADARDASRKSPATVHLRAGGALLTLELLGEGRRLVMIERESGIPHLLSAAHVTALQEFRDLYPRTAVAAGQRIRVGRMAFLFSDLKGSTAMFEQLGDGPAYAQVHDHFEFMTQVVRAHHGAVVKTIGDAIMAVFSQSADAVRAALAIQRGLPAFNAQRPSAPPLSVKLGVHAGACVVTSANELLDYFGTTVNLAARVQAQSVGGDVVLLSQLLSEPEVAAVAAGIRREDYVATLAGLQSQYSLTRLSPEP
jgi:class 3 adenylate cyclase